MVRRKWSLILASASPRRSELLRAAGYEFVVRVADVDEASHTAESPEAYVRRVAIDKARAVARQPGEFVLAADTTVVVDGAILGKPSDVADAVRMLGVLAGRAHDVLTGVCLLRPAGAEVRVASTRVE